MKAGPGQSLAANDTQAEYRSATFRGIFNATQGQYVIYSELIRCPEGILGGYIYYCFFIRGSEGLRGN